MFSLFRKNKAPVEPDRSHIVPRIKHRDMLAALEEMGVPKTELPVVEPFVADLLVSYAFDLPGLFQLVTPGDLTRLGIAEGELREIASANLRRQVSDIETVGQPPVLMLSAGNDLEACLLLVDEVWESLEQQIPGEIVVSVPTRNVLMVTSGESPEGLAFMRELADGARDRESKHRLTERFLIRRGGRWELYQESA